jgi:hypothetical protein
MFKELMMKNFSDLMVCTLAALEPASMHGSGDPAAGGPISVDRSAVALGLTEEETVEVLVGVRTWLHNRCFAHRLPETGPLPAANVERSVTDALAIVADQLDAIDVVFARLDARVAHRVPVVVPIVSGEQFERDLIAASVGQGAHGAAWLALRSEGAERYEFATAYGLPEGTQLPLPFDGTECADDASASVAPQRRNRHRRGFNVAPSAAPRCQALSRPSPATMGVRVGGLAAGCAPRAAMRQ